MLVLQTNNELTAYRHVWPREPGSQRVSKSMTEIYLISVKEDRSHHKVFVGQTCIPCLIPGTMTILPEQFGFFSLLFRKKKKSQANLQKRFSKKINLQHSLVRKILKKKKYYFRLLYLSLTLCLVEKFYPGKDNLLFYFFLSVSLSWK